MNILASFVSTGEECVCVPCVCVCVCMCVHLYVCVCARFCNCCVRRVSALASAMVGGAKKKRMQARKRSAGVCIYDVVQKEAER